MSDKHDKDSFKVDVGDSLIQEAVDSIDKHQKPAQETVAEKSADEEAQEENYYERLVRVSADFDNFRKRYQREKINWHRFGAENFICALLPSIDNLERAVAQCPEDSEFDSIRQGLSMVLSQLGQVFKDQGLTSFDPLGETFDPLLHEAMDTKVVENVAENEVVEVHYKGYKLWDRVIRPARVTVAKSPETSDED